MLVGSTGILFLMVAFFRFAASDWVSTSIKGWLHPPYCTTISFAKLPRSHHGSIPHIPPTPLVLRWDGRLARGMFSPWVTDFLHSSGFWSQGEELRLLLKGKIIALYNQLKEPPASFDLCDGVIVSDNWFESRTLHQLSRSWILLDMNMLLSEGQLSLLQNDFRFSKRFQPPNH